MEDNTDRSNNPPGSPNSNLTKSPADPRLGKVKVWKIDPPIPTGTVNLL